MKKGLIIWCFIAASLTSVAQDFHLSQYEASPLYFNPSLTGLFDGDYRISMNFRNQWSAITTNAFRTAGVQFDRKFEKFNGGFYILNNQAGAGKFNALTAVVSGSYDYALPNDPHHHFVGGLQLGVINKSVDFNALQFGNQYDNANGGSFDNNASSNENYANSSIFMPELNIGATWYFASDRSKINPFVGASVFHLTSPKESFFGGDNQLPRRYSVNAGVKYNLSKRFQLSAYFLGMNQTNANEYTGTLMGHYHLKKSDTYLMMGSTYRSADALMVHLGIKYRDFTYRFSYDINTSALTAITAGRGGFEMSIVYVMRKIDPNPVRSCPRM